MCSSEELEAHFQAAKAYALLRGKIAELRKQGVGSSAAYRQTVRASNSLLMQYYAPSLYAHAMTVSLAPVLIPQEAEQETIRKQKEAEEKQRNEAWNGAIQHVKNAIRSGKSTDEALQLAFSHVDGELSDGEILAWRNTLKVLASQELELIEHERAEYEKQLEERRTDEKKRNYDAAVQAHQEELARTRNTHVPYPGRIEAGFLRTVIGHEGFRKSVKDILDLLNTYVPHRYKEILEYLPQAVFIADLRFNGKEVAGLSDGHFSQDGMGRDSKFLKIWQLNTLYSFMKTIIHETGHNVLNNRRLPNSERDTDVYAKQVIQEMIWSGFEAKLTDFQFSYLEEFPSEFTR